MDQISSESRRLASLRAHPVDQEIESEVSNNENSKEDSQILKELCYTHKAAAELQQAIDLAQTTYSVHREDLKKLGLTEGSFQGSIVSPETLVQSLEQELEEIEEQIGSSQVQEEGAIGNLGVCENQSQIANQFLDGSAFNPAPQYGGEIDFRPIDSQPCCSALANEGFLADDLHKLLNQYENLREELTSTAEGSLKESSQKVREEFEKTKKEEQDAKTLFAHLFGFTNLVESTGGFHYLDRQSAAIEEVQSLNLGSQAGRADFQVCATRAIEGLSQALRAETAEAYILLQLFNKYTRYILEHTRVSDRERAQHEIIALAKYLNIEALIPGLQDQELDLSTFNLLLNTVEDFLGDVSPVLPKGSPERAELDRLVEYLISDFQKNNWISRDVVGHGVHKLSPRLRVKEKALIEFTDNGEIKTLGEDKTTAYASFKPNCERQNEMLIHIERCVKSFTESHKALVAQIPLVTEHPAFQNTTLQLSFNSTLNPQLPEDAARPLFAPGASLNTLKNGLQNTKTYLEALFAQVGRLQKAREEHAEKVENMHEALDEQLVALGSDPQDALDNTQVASDDPADDVSIAQKLEAVRLLVVQRVLQTQSKMVDLESRRSVIQHRIENIREAGEVLSREDAMALYYDHISKSFVTYETDLTIQAKALKSQIQNIKEDVKTAQKFLDTELENQRINPPAGEVAIRRAQSVVSELNSNVSNAQSALQSLESKYQFAIGKSLELANKKTELARVASFVYEAHKKMTRAVFLLNEQVMKGVVPPEEAERFSQMIEELEVRAENIFPDLADSLRRMLSEVKMEAVATLTRTMECEIQDGVEEAQVLEQLEAIRIEHLRNLEEEEESLNKVVANYERDLEKEHFRKDQNTESTLVDRQQLQLSLDQRMIELRRVTEILNANERGHNHLTPAQVSDYVVSKTDLEMEIRRLQTEILQVSSKIHQVDADYEQTRRSLIDAAQKAKEQFNNRIERIERDLQVATKESSSYRHSLERRAQRLKSLDLQLTSTTKALEGDSSALSIVEVIKNQTVENYRRALARTPGIVDAVVARLQNEEAPKSGKNLNLLRKAVQRSFTELKKTSFKDPDKAEVQVPDQFLVSTLVRESGQELLINYTDNEIAEVIVEALLTEAQSKAYQEQCAILQNAFSDLNLRVQDYVDSVSDLEQRAEKYLTREEGAYKRVEETEEAANVAEESLREAEGRSLDCSRLQQLLTNIERFFEFSVTYQGQNPEERAEVVRLRKRELVREIEELELEVNPDDSMIATVANTLRNLLAEEKASKEALTRARETLKIAAEEAKRDLLHIQTQVCLYEAHLQQYEQKLNDFQQERANLEARREGLRYGFIKKIFRVFDLPISESQLKIVANT